MFLAIHAMEALGLHAQAALDHTYLLQFRGQPGLLIRLLLEHHARQQSHDLLCEGRGLNVTRASTDPHRACLPSPSTKISAYSRNPLNVHLILTPTSARAMEAPCTRTCSAVRSVSTLKIISVTSTSSHVLTCGEKQNAHVRDKRHVNMRSLRCRFCADLVRDKPSVDHPDGWSSIKNQAYLARHSALQLDDAVLVDVPQLQCTSVYG